MEHYFSEKQSSKLILKKIKISLKNIDFELYSAPGVFSKNKLDIGTRLLIEKSVVQGKTLDLGCGIGVIGIALKKLNPSLNITISDINERAIFLARKNSANMDINIVKSDVFSNIKEKFDTILINLPQSAGKELCFKMIRESYLHLNSNGLLEIVARHNKGGKTYMKYMQEIFGNSKDTAKASGYRIYSSKKLI